MQTWLDYLEDLFHDGRISERIRDQIAEGAIEVCPVCLGLTALELEAVDATENVLQTPFSDGHAWECVHCNTRLTDRTRLN